MAELVLMAEPREVHGKKVKHLRREGLVPGVIYGPVLNETISVSVNQREFYRFYMAHGHSTIFTLKWGEGEEMPVLIRDVQLDPIRRDMLHVDFFAPNMRVKLRQSVPLLLHNASEHIEAGGVLQHILMEIEVEALPRDLPADIPVDISGLVNIGDALTVADITVDGAVEIITEPETVVANITHQVVEEPAEDEGGEAEEATEGDAEAESAEESSEE